MSIRVPEGVTMNRFVIGLVAFVAGTISFIAYGQEHNHGLKGLPGWYDRSCCNEIDCRPVENDNDIVFEQLEGRPVARHVPTGSIFERRQFRQSQDERYHVCINGNLLPVCFYDRPGA